MDLLSQCASSFDSPIGRLRVSASETHLLAVKLRAPDLPDSHGSEAANTLARRSRQEIEAYLQGELDQFTVRARISGSPFQRAVWKEMTRIPYGKTLTYGQMARILGEVGASRAVGMACGSNPLPLVVPCHRILAQNGLGGFGGGLEMKRWLLHLEAYHRPPELALGESAPTPAGERFDDSLSLGEQQSLF